MALDPSIILRGQPLDVVGAMRQGNAAAMETNQIRQQNALANVYQTQGAGLLAGDQGALNALAGVDPAAAFNMRGAQQDYAMNTRKMEILNAEEKRAIADAAAQMDAAQKEAALAQARQEVFQIIAAPTPELFDQMVTQAGKPELVGQFANRKMLGAQYITEVSDLFKLVDGPEPMNPTKGAPSGYMFTDPANPAAGVAPLPGYTPQPLVQVNNDQNSGTFAKEADKQAATRYSTIVSEGQNAQTMMGDLSALAALAPQIGTGKEAQIMAAIGPYAQALGVPVDGLGEAQAYQAIIDRLAPQMRPAGAGATSDFDARQFLSSLPGLGKTPEGNAIISATLQAIQQQKLAAAEIGRKAFNNEITWQQADQQIADLGNPYERFNKYRNVQSGANGGTATSLSEDALNYLNTP